MAVCPRLASGNARPTVNPPPPGSAVASDRPSPALKRLRPINHTDFVVAPPGQPFAIWTAVNRIPCRVVIIGPDQRVTPPEALKAVTINAASQ